MFLYYLDFALRGLKRNPGITVLMVLGIGVGVALAMSSWTLVHLMSHDPIPEKSAQLYFPTIDAWGPKARSKENGDEPPNLLDYSTTMALLHAHRAKYQAAIYGLNPTVFPTRPGEFPFNVRAYAVSNEFFMMVNALFKFGSGWTAADEAGGAQVTVISQQLNGKLFGGGNSIGKTLTAGGRQYRVVGVMHNWDPQPAFFDLDQTKGLNGFATQSTGLYLPFTTAIAAQEGSLGSQCYKEPEDTSFAAFLHSTCAWISYMVQLDTPAAAHLYLNYLESFARDRFDWPPNVRLRDVMAWLTYQQVVPDRFKLVRLVGAGLFIVCLVDTLGLMLAKFLRRSGEIGVRRALGASRRAIYEQVLTEAAVIGVAGGILGVILTILAMAWLRSNFPSQWASVAQLNVGLLGMTLTVAIVATVLAGLYPAWRAAHIPPALQIKSN